MNRLLAVALLAVGYGLIVYGAFLFSRPVGFVVAGALLVSVMIADMGL